MKIASFNINGIRAASSKGLWDWLKETNVDFLGVQEVKAHQEQVNLAEVEEMGYHVYWHAAEKKGYSGVAIFSKMKPDQVVIGMDNDKYDNEGRVIRADFGDLTILNCYFPSGSSGEERHGFKLEFLADFKAWVKELMKEREQLIVIGDYNIVHTEKDIHNPERKDNPSGYRPEERQWMDEWFELGFTDAFRKMNPDEISFSWWSYRAGARPRNKGWRIDYCSVSTPIAGNIIKSHHQKDPVYSDHCPVITELDIKI
jgi:exodeoxyribonuclease-3